LDRVFSNSFLPIVIVRRLGLLVMKYVPLVKVISLKLMIGLLGKTPEIAKR
jgi:2-octaprenyl-6-methoxyphenol hydroxylase